jgi:AbrB family looped-hinge helix DNA binding protein
MAIAKAKISSQGQISIPAEVRKMLGVGPGDVVEFNEDDGSVVLTRAKGVTFADIHEALFPEGPPPHFTDEEIEKGLLEEIAAERRK